VLFFRTFVALDDVESAEAEFRLLGKDMSTLMMNLVLLTCVNAQQPDRALDLLREAHLLEQGLHDNIVDTVSYNTVLRGYSKAAKGRRCMECFHEMRAHGIQPDDITYNVLLDVCNADGVVPLADVMQFVIGTSDELLCNAFIKSLVRNRQLQSAHEFLTELHRLGTPPGLAVYTMMIKAFIDQQQELDTAMAMVKMLREAGHEPDDMVLTLLLEGCHHSGNQVLGKMVFKELVEGGVKPSGFTLITMVKMLGRCGEHEEAHELVSTWAAKFGSEPSVIHYTCLMSGCLRRKNYDQAWRAYELMCESGIQLDDTLLATLLPGMSLAQRWDRCISLVETAVRGPKRINIPLEMVNSTLSHMLDCVGPGELTAKLQALMPEAGVPCSLRRTK
jgi:pentatricopeptide repeat protein